MNIGLITLLIFGSLLILMATGLPIAFCIISVAIVGWLVFMGPPALSLIANNGYSVVTTDIFIAIPTFVFMAAVLEGSGMGRVLYEMMHKWFGGLRGGLAIGTTAICTLIAAMTGLAATAVVMMGVLAYSEMNKRGYDKGISLGCIISGGALGPLIPPSIVMIIIGGLTSLSVGKLFMGGLFPGLLISFLFIAYTGIRCYFQPKMGPPLPREERASWGEKFASLRGVILPIILVLLVLGSIYAGAATPSEAGGVGAFGTIICAIIYRQFNLKMLKAAISKTLQTTVMVLWLVIGGLALSSLLSGIGVSNYVLEVITGLPISPMGIIIVIMVILLILGMFIDTTAIIMIMIPITIPLIRELGFDPLWFALVFVINILTGLITPPYGICIFYMKGVAPPDVTIKDLYLSTLPFTLIMIAVLGVSIVWPPLVTWLPNKLIK